MNVPRKYGLVRAIAVLLKLLAVLVLILGIVGLVASLNFGSQLALPQWISVSGAVALPLIALLTAMQLYAFGSILSLLVKLEENTRAMAQPPVE
jgi:protein-S-isoprenylcysteine O-methyltransferase Ste14